MKLLQHAIVLALSLTIISCGSYQDKKKGTEEVAKASFAQASQQQTQPADTMTTGKSEKVVKSEAEWKQILTDKEYRILRKGGTELPYVNEYYDNKKEGIYYCAACGNKLYSSEHKYKSGTGWPSFWQPIEKGAVEEKPDSSLFMVRTEIVCARCGSHLGHVFEDGPDPTGLRYCMNSAALDFKSREELKEES